MLSPKAILIESVLEQLPAAIHQAHERIIGGRQVPNEDKIIGCMTIP